MVESKCLYEKDCPEYTTECQEDHPYCSIFRKRANADAQIRILRQKELENLGIGAMVTPFPFFNNKREEDVSR